MSVTVPILLLEELFVLIERKITNTTDQAALLALEDIRNKANELRPLEPRDQQRESDPPPSPATAEIPPEDTPAVIGQSTVQRRRRRVRRKMSKVGQILDQLQTFSVYFENREILFKTNFLK